MKRKALLGLSLASTLLLNGVAHSELPPVPIEVQEYKYKGVKFTPTEQYVLDFFQERGITDRSALATILGNIKAESMFHPNICEGGARVRYENCHRGGFGLIQWTTTNRYKGLGLFANKYGGNPSELHTQLRYLVNESQWLNIEYKMKTPGMTIAYYMDAAYYWLGWGIHGNRTHYAHDYYHRLA